MTSIDLKDITTITALQLNDKLLGERVAGTTRQISFTNISDSASKPLLEFTAVASAVNNIIISNNITNSNPSVSATGSDTNISLDVLAKGTGSVNLKSTSASAVKILSGTGYQHTTTLSVPTTSASKTITIPDYDFTAVGATTAGTAGQVLTSSGSSSSVPSWSSSPRLTSVLDASGATSVVFYNTGGSANYLTFVAAGAGNFPYIAATGSDSNIHLSLQPKGANSLKFTTAAPTLPIEISSGTLGTHIANFNFADTVGTFNYTFPDLNMTLAGTTVAASGTGKSSFTAYTPIVGGTTTTGNLQSMASAGSSGQIMQSGGASAVPAWSTPTYPSTSATSGKMLKSDGTNWVASTETYAAPSTSGKVMQSDGTNWTSAAPTGTGVPVLATTPTLVTPVLGVATATSINFGGGALSTYFPGSYTPTVAFGGASVGITYSTNTGIYVRNGDLVTFAFAIVLTSKGSSTGTFTVLNALPIATKSSSISQTWGCLVENLTALTTPVVIYAPTNSTTMTPLRLQNPGSSQTMSDTAVANNTTLFVTGSYLV